MADPASKTPVTGGSVELQGVKPKVAVNGSAGIKTNEHESVEKMIAALLGDIESSDMKLDNGDKTPPIAMPDASKDGINSVIHALLDALQGSVQKKEKKAAASTSKTEVLPKVVEEVPRPKENPKKAWSDDGRTEEEWKIREKVLLAKIGKLEEQANDDIKYKALELKLKLKSDENEIFRAKLKSLETELTAVLSKPNGKNKDMVAKIKKQHDELLTKARGMIFDKTKMIKNQELQIEALSSQVSSLKEVVSCTKDLLNIRNMEVVHLQERLEVMDMKIQAEKDRHNLMMKKMETGTKVNDELKKEYLKQMDLFKCLKSKYEEKFRALEANQKEPEAPSTSASAPAPAPTPVPVLENAPVPTADTAPVLESAPAISPAQENGEPKQ